MRFYGGTYQQWLFETPIGIIESLVAQIPALQSEERLAKITDGSVSAGLVKRNFAQKHFRNLAKACGRYAKAVKVSPDELPKGLGIGVK